MGMSFWHLLVILTVVLLVFGGGGRLSKTMGDFGKGIRALREGLKTDEELQSKQITDKSDQPPQA